MAGPNNKLKAALASVEPIFVFGTDTAGTHVQETAAVARRLYRAEVGKSAGPTGQSYAIAYRDSDQKLLPLAALRKSIEAFLAHAKAGPGTGFHIARFGCEPGAHSDAVMAPLFAHVPVNCQLPGVWLRILDPKQPARLLIFDPRAQLTNEVWQKQLRHFIDMNMPLWNVSAVELVTVGAPRSVVACDAAAKALKLRLKVVGISQDLYGRVAHLVAEYRAISYATHLLCIFNIEHTSHPQQIRLMTTAKRCGLTLDQLDTTAA